MGFRYAICNEIFKDWDFAQACRLARRLGYTGLEIAPFTLAESVEAISAERRRQLRTLLADEGLDCVGLHWLLVSPKGLWLTTADAALRRRSWDYLVRLIDFCGDLGGRLMILGSPHQRRAEGSVTVREATERLIEGLAGLAPSARARDVTLLIEAVSPKETNVVTRLDEAARVVEAVAHPSVQTMFDAHNAADEGGDPIALLDRHYEKIRHVHVNETDGRHPGTGHLNFAGLLGRLAERGYGGWVSLEVFNFEAGAETIARESIGFLSAIERRQKVPDHLSEPDPRRPAHQG